MLDIFNRRRTEPRDPEKDPYEGWDVVFIKTKVTNHTNNFSGYETREYEVFKQAKMSGRWVIIGSPAKKHYEVVDLKGTFTSPEYVVSWISEDLLEIPRRDEP